jgi:integrase
MGAIMAFVTDKEELKPGLIIFRRGDLQGRDWYCRVRLPKATRYKTIALKTPDITTARTLAYDHESEIRFALKRNLPVFNRPFAAVAKDYIAEQTLRALRGEITAGRVKLIESVVKNQLNPYVGKTQIDLIALDRWQNYPSWRRSLGQGRMTRHGNVRPMTEAECAAAKTIAEGKAKLRRVGKQAETNPKPEKTDWIIVSDATIRFEMKIYRAIINDAVAKQEAPPHHRIEGMPSLEKQRRDAFTLEEYRRLHTHARTKWVGAAKTKTARWYRDIVYNFVLIMCNTGMRPSEARNLRWRDVTEATDKNGQPVTVLSVRGKGKSRQLVAPSGNVGKYLNRIRAIAVSTAPEAPVFSSATGTPERTLYKAFIANLLDDANLRLGPSGILRSTYSFRHTYATIRLTEGVSELLLAEQMGTSVQMIQEHYGHVDTIKHADLVLQGMSDWEPAETTAPAEDQQATQIKRAARARRTTEPRKPH